MRSLPTSSKPSSKTASKPGEMIRLNRFLADCNLGSRRKTEALISSGKISVNGVICTDLSSKIDPQRDEVSFEGRLLKAETEKIFIILNKPAGYVVSQSDEYKRKTVYDLLPSRFASLPYAGRLDKNSEGLLLFCNDGKLIKRLTHPSHKVEKVYRVQIEPKLPRPAIAKLRQGVEIAGGLTQSAGVYVKSQSEHAMTLKMVITEGRKHQIRLMIEAVGAKVKNLRRLQFGPLLLKDLPVGRWRVLQDYEIRALYSAGEKYNKSSQTKDKS